VQDSEVIDTRFLLQQKEMVVPMRTLFSIVIIAATAARMLKLTVVTRNVGDFKRFGVPVLNPFRQVADQAAPGTSQTSGASHETCPVPHGAMPHDAMDGLALRDFNAEALCDGVSDEGAYKRSY